MAKVTVKHKLPVTVVLFLLAATTFAASFLGVWPAVWVESIFARGVFPTISHIFGIAADAVPFSLFDVAIVATAVAVLYTWRKRRWRLLLGLMAGGYLWFFWTWGLNYHRPPLAERMDLGSAKVTSDQVERFAELALTELNRLQPQTDSLDSSVFEATAADRVRRVVSRIDGTDWRASSRVKHSWIAQGWFKIAGVEGMFNPFGHEPLVTSGLLDVELPFCISHEMAHVWGNANEGDANLIAFLATIASDNPAFQYSGWLNIWNYVRSAKLDALLAPGVVADRRAIALRMRSQQVDWAADVQSAVLDLHLKANDVKEGITSYSRFVTQAIASQDRWDQYR